jgi:hypothetical protein
MAYQDTSTSVARTSEYQGIRYGPGRGLAATRPAPTGHVLDPETMTTLRLDRPNPSMGDSPARGPFTSHH